MAFEFKFPDVGEGIHEGELVKWLVKEGDTVKGDQPLAEMETDKAVVEIPSPRAGKILKLHYKEADTVPVGQVLVTIGEAGESYQGPAAALVTPTPAPVRAPSTTGAAAVPPRQASPAAEREQEPETTAALPFSAGNILASPHTRMLARKLGVELSRVRGTGPGGRVSDEDVQKAGKDPGYSLPGARPASTARESPAPIGTRSPGPALASSPTPSQPNWPPAPIPGHGFPDIPLPDFEREGQVERIPIRGLRKKIAERMTKSFYTAPHVTHLEEVDVTELDALRKKEKEHAEGKGVHLTYLPFFIKACVIALKEHPVFNSSFDDGKQEIAVKKYFNVGIAVDTPEGLIVPVIKQADHKGLLELAREIQELAEKARERKLALEELRGGTFTLTNIGSLGGIGFTPIINWPEVAILGIGKIEEKPVVLEGQIRIRKRMVLALSFDHRVADGAQAARFVNDIKKHLEDPGLLLVDV